MKIKTLIYSLGQGFKNIRRNKLFSLASIGTITACIFLMGLFYAVLANFQHMVDEAGETVCVTVFFKEGIGQQEIETIGNQIKSRLERQELCLYFDSK